MNRKTFSLVTSLAILTSSLSPTWAAGKDFTYNNINQNLQIKAPVDETKEGEEKIDLPLVTETLPDESVRNKYVKIIFIPETSKVGRNQNYGKLRDEEGKEISLSDITCKIESRDVVVKGKEYYALKSARWIDAFNYKENGKEVMSVRKADNNESDLEKKNSHKFSGWKFSNKTLQPSVNTLAINLKDHSINNPVIIRSIFHSRPFFYYNGSRPKFDPDDYRLTNDSEYLNITFQIDSNGSKGNCMLKLNNTQREYAFEDAYNSDNIIYLTLRKKPGIYTFKDYKPEATSNENTSFWYWDIRNPFVPTGKEVAEDLDIGLEKNTIAFKGIFVARYIDKYSGVQEDFDFINNPIPKGCYKLKLEAEEGYSLTGITFHIYGVRSGISLNEVEDINREFKLQDENGEIYQGKVAWYDGYKKIDNPNEFKINSDIVLTARPVKDYESEKFTPEVKKIEVNKDEDVTLEKLKSGITNLPEDIKDLEIVENVNTSKVGEGKAVLKLIFTDTSSKEVIISVNVIEKISGGAVPPIPKINKSDITKEEVPYNGTINLLDNIKNLPDGAKVEDVSEKINTKISGTYTGKVRVTFKDGSSRIVVIPIEVSKALASSYTPQVKEIEVNKDELVTLEKLESGIVNLPEDINDIEIVENVDTSKVGKGKAVVKIIFSDTSSKEVVIPVRVTNVVDAGLITPVPEIKAEDIIKEEVPYNGEINLLDNIENLPDGAEIKDISETIDTKVPGTYTGKVKVIFKDGSSRIVDIPIEVLEALASSYTTQVKEIEVNKDELVTLEKLKSGITNLPENIKEIEITTPPDTSKVGEGKAVLKIIFSDISSKEVEVPVKVIEKISGGEITPIPKINDSDIIKEEVPYNGTINLLDNIKNLPDGAEVQDISETIDTKIPGTYTGKLKVTFKDGSSRIVEVPVEVLIPMAEKFSVQNPDKIEVENLESINPTEKSEIEEKVRQANPQVDLIEVDHRGNVTLIYEDGSINKIEAKNTLVLKEETPEKEDYGDKPGEEGNKDSEDKPGQDGDKDPEEKPREEGDKDPEEKPGKEDKKNPEDNKDKDKEKEDAKDNEVKENPKDYEEEDNKKTENKRDSLNDFPRYYVRNHRTPTYKVETKITYKESKPQVNSKKFVINMKAGTYTTIEDGKTLERSMEVKPLIKDDRTFLPLRALADILDAKVIWNEGTRIASFTRDGLTALIQIDGNKIVLSNGETIELESKPLNINGRIYLPLVNVAQVFGLTSGNSLDGEDQDIEWNNMDKTVTINIK